MEDFPLRGLTAPGKLPPQDWLSHQDTQRVFKALCTDGADVRFVGGCVRNALVQKAITDIDLATPDTPEKVMSLLKKAQIRSIPTGLCHGTVTAVINKKPFQITTLRQDVETDGRHAKVKFTDSWAIDAQRRDFTINTLSCNLEGDVFDPLETALEDLAQGRIRFVGLADERVQEDYLRILRYFRFSAWFGRKPPDPKALHACKTYAPCLSTLSGERIYSELKQLLMVPNVADIFQLMRHQNVLEPIIPEARSPEILRILSWLETRAVTMDIVRPDHVRRLAALILDSPDNIASVSQRLKLSNVEKKRLVMSQNPEASITPDMALEEVAKKLHLFGPEIITDRILLQWANQQNQGHGQNRHITKSWVQMLEKVQQWKPKTFPLKGRDILDTGLSPGPQIGEILETVYRWWTKENFLPDRRQCLKKLKEITGQNDKKN